MIDLNTYEAPKAPRGPRPLPKVGAQPARVVQIATLGIQTRPPFQGKAKTPIDQLWVSFELVNDKYKDDNGNERVHRISPRVFNIMTDEKAQLMKFLKAIDPQGEVGTKISQLLNRPCLVSVIHAKDTKGNVDDNGKPLVYANFAGVSPVPEGFPVAECSVTPTAFDFRNPDMESAKALPRWIRDIIKKALNYKGSKVEPIFAAIDAESEKAPTPAPESDDFKDDDIPF